MLYVVLAVMLLALLAAFKIFKGVVKLLLVGVILIILAVTFLMREEESSAPAAQTPAETSL